MKLQNLEIKKFTVHKIFGKSKTNKASYAEECNEICKLGTDGMTTLLKLKTEIQEQKLESRKTQLQSKVDYCEGRINEIVYSLYELREDEIKIVESK